MIAFILLVAQTVGVAPAPTAALPTVFGLQLGAPVALPECLRADLGGGKRSEHAYEHGQATVCQGLPGVETAALD